MMIQVMKEYYIEPSQVVAEHQELYKEYTRWNGDDPEGFVAHLSEVDIDAVLREAESDFVHVEFL